MAGDDEEFVVESLLNVRTKGGVKQFLVKWEGYSAKHNSWEPRKELIQSCLDLVQEIEAKKSSARSRSPAKRERSPAPSAAVLPGAGDVLKIRSATCRSSRSPGKQSALGRQLLQLRPVHLAGRAINLVVHAP
jgi:hypothetical protein